MKKMKKLIALSLALLMMLMLCACGKSYRSESAQAAPAAMAMPVPNVEMAEAEEYGLASYAAADMKSAVSGSGSEAPQENPDKIIYSATATVETTSFEETLAGVEEMIKQYGAWIESSSISGTDYFSASRGYNSNRSADYTIRVPSDKFDTMMSSLSVLGNVPYTYIYTENVTAQYYDVQAHLTAYRTQETRLLEMMEKAETVEDIITIEDRLTELRYRIESLQSSLNNWDRRVSYSTVSLNVQEVREYTPETNVPRSYGAELWDAFVSALKNVGRFFKDLLVFLVSALPALAILTALFFIFRPLMRRWRDKAKKRREERKSRKSE